MSKPSKWYRLYEQKILIYKAKGLKTMLVITYFNFKQMLKAIFNAYGPQCLL